MSADSIDPANPPASESLDSAELGESSSRCPNCQRLERQVAELQQRLADLESALQQALRRGNRQAAPFGRDASKPDPQKPGRRAGQGPFTFRQAPPEQTIKETLEAPLPHCPHCFGPVSDLRTHQHLQTDLPLPLEPVTCRFLTQSGFCPRCRRRVHSRYPGQVSTAAGAAGVSLGPRARALAAEIKHGLGVPYAKIARLFAGAFGLKVTPSALCQSGARLAEAAEPVYQEMLLALRACRGGVHADETGWRVGALSSWLWSFTHERLTVYTVEKGAGSRSHEVVLRILGKDFAGVLVSDCFLAYDAAALSCWLKQKCYAHLLKDLSALQKEKKGTAARFCGEVALVLREALALGREKSVLPAPVFEERAAELEARLDGLIHARRRFTDVDNARLARRLRKQRSHLFTFLYHPGVEATNNRAERALRPAVIVRKTGGCNKSDVGAKVHAILTSLLVSARQQGLCPVQYLVQLLCGAPKLPSLTDGTDATTMA